VYCVVSAEAPQPFDQPGIDPAHGVTTVECAGLAAVISRVPLAEFDEAVLSDQLEDMTWVERTVRSHERVVQSVAAQSTPVPMRVCSIFRDREGVSEMLQRERAALGDALAQLRDTAEWGVKVFAGPATDLVSVGAGGDRADGDGDGCGVGDGDEDGDGTAYMHRRLDARRQKADAHVIRQDACAEVHEGLRRCARDARVIPVQRPEISGRPRPMILNAAYLVPHEDDPAFQAEVERVRGEVSALGLELEMSGPWPPYNFVPSGIGGA
jgi:hypothetical protein